MIEVEALPTAVRVIIPRADVDAATLESWIGWLRAETILRRSALTEEEADRMAE